MCNQLKKVLIADDEYLVRLGLKTTVDWAGHGFDIVGEAANGQEAIHLFEQTDPDILLTDIKMPVVDGLSLIETLKARKPSLYVVILTHYSDFSYAQKAILLGASQYILKSELNEQSILSTLDRLLSSMEGLQSPYRCHESQLREYLRQCLILPRGADPEKLLPTFEGLMEDGCYSLVSCRCDTFLLPEENQEMFHRSIRAMLEKVWPKPYLVSAQQEDMLRVYLVLQLEESEFSVMCQYMQRAVMNIRQYYDVEFQAGISQTGNPSRIYEMLREAGQACDECFFMNTPCCIYASSPRSDVCTQPQVNQAWIQDVIQTRDWSRLKSYIQEVFKDLTKKGSIDCVQNAYIDFLSFARHLMSRYPVLNTAQLNEEKLNYHNFQNLHHINTVESFVLDIYRSILDILNGQVRRYSGVINRCIDFIHSHFVENIALSDAAAAVNVSKSYLSLLFKQETGINFSKYLMDYRVEEAKELLSNTNMHIYEVAERVGFPNPYYFSKVFKEATGFSCKEYKNITPS